MLTFTSLGGTSVRLTGGTKPFVVFPAKPEHKDAIVLMPNPQEENTDSMLSWPGEYNLAGVSIKGIGHLEGQQVSYVLEADGIRIAFLSAPLQDWTDKQMELVGEIDVLVLPVSDSKLTQKLVDEFDPRILLLLRTDAKDAYDAVAKIIGVKETVEEYKLKGSLPAEGREVICLAA